MEARPPALIEAIATRLIPPDSREPVLGDLHESYTTPGRYVAAVAALAPRLLLQRVRRLLKAEYGLYCAELAALTTWFASNQRAQSLLPAATMVLVLMLRDAYVDVTERPDTPEGRGDAFSAALAGSARDQLLAIAAMWVVQFAFVPQANRTAADVLLNLSGFGLLMLGMIRVGWWALYAPGTRRSRFRPVAEGARGWDAARSLTTRKLRLLLVRVLGLLAIGAGVATIVVGPPHTFVRLLVNVSAMMTLADVGQRAEQRLEETVG